MRMGYATEKSRIQEECRTAESRDRQEKKLRTAEGRDRQEKGQPTAASRSQQEQSTAEGRDRQEQEQPTAESRDCQERELRTAESRDRQEQELRSAENRSQRERYAAELDAVRRRERREQVPEEYRAARDSGDPVERYKYYLAARGRRKNTVEKYARDVRTFLRFRQDRELDHSCLDSYQVYLLNHYKPASVNSMLVALNQYLVFLGRAECCVHLFRIQQALFRDRSRELTREEYTRLVKQAERDGKRRLSCILQTLGSTGIRVSELPYITVESLEQKTASVCCKGKIRQILLSAPLIRLLGKYCRDAGITSGPVFITRSGRPMDRRNIWKEMKCLCKDAGVEPKKVFPHNFRHLFACSFYAREKDIVRLADYLGHSSVETTRRYTMTADLDTCRNQLNLGLTTEEWEEEQSSQQTQKQTEAQQPAQMQQQKQSEAQAQKQSEAQAQKQNSAGKKAGKKNRGNRRKSRRCRKAGRR